MLFLKPTFVLLGGLFFGSTLAHDETFEELVAREQHTENARRELAACQHELFARDDLHERRMAKRDAFIDAYALENGITRRDTPFAKRDIDLSERAVSCKHEFKILYPTRFSLLEFNL